MGGWRGKGGRKGGVMGGEEWGGRVGGKSGIMEGSGKRWGLQPRLDTDVRGR